MRRGFTLLEVMVVMAIAALMLLVATQTLFRSTASLSIDAALGRLIAESRQQQMRAMAGDTTPLGSYIDYSVHISSDRYILFPGNVYDEGNPVNTEVTLEAPLVITSITFPSSNLTFTRSSGEVSGFVSGQNSFVLENPQTGERRTVSVNIYGVFSVSQ